MSSEAGPAIHSVVVAIDGEAKCGKTTVIGGIAEEALYQASIIPRMVEGDPSVISKKLPDQTLEQLLKFHEHMAFNSIATLSAGNMFRAAAMYRSMLESHGHDKTEFNEADTNVLRRLLATPGIHDTLQSDPKVGEQVSAVAQMLGVHALCGSLFCDSISEAYNQNGGGNLVIVDARDPIGHMRRNHIIGRQPGQIHPSSIIPLYIDTLTETAASRMPGDFEANLSVVTNRRLMDATREDYPVRRPAVLIDDFHQWAKALFSDLGQRETPVPPYRLDNGAEVGLDQIQNFSGHIAVIAQEIGHNLYHYTSPATKCWDPS